MSPTGEGATYATNPLCTEGPDEPFCASAGTNVWRFETTADGSLFAILSDDPDLGRAFRYFPTLGEITTQIDEVTGIEAIPAGLVVTGYPDGQSVEMMTLYAPQIGSEQVLVDIQPKVIFAGIGWDSANGVIAFRAYRGYEPDGGWKVGHVPLGGGYNATTVDDHDTMGLVTF
jgi:hypothetical protein